MYVCVVTMTSYSSNPSSTILKGRSKATSKSTMISKSKSFPHSSVEVALKLDDMLNMQLISLFVMCIMTSAANEVITDSRTDKVIPIPVRRNIPGV